MQGIGDVILSLWKQGRKTHATPSGWIGGNCPHCSDKRGRGGIILNPDGSIAFSCFNCSFKAKYSPGEHLSLKMKTLLESLGASDELIQQLTFLALKNNNTTYTIIKTNIPKFNTIELPPNSQLIRNITPTKELIPILEYIHSRGLYLEDYDFYYSDTLQFKKRLLIPFYYENNIVGYTGRRIDNNPQYRYLSNQQPGYLFNLDNQTDKEFVIVCEGVIDAISIGGVALLGSNITEIHAAQLKRLNKEIILVPDHDKNGLETITHALEYDWSVSFPQWNVKDINDSIRKYGRLGTLWMIKEATTNNKTKIELQRKLFKGEKY